MPGPLTTVARVRELGGLNDAAAINVSAHHLFGLADVAALDTRITTEILIASAWLQSRAGADYDSGDTVKDTLFGEAEAYLALQNLYETLKMRRVTGTHHPLMQEASERFEALIDVEMPEHIKKFVDAYLVIEEQGQAEFAAPAFALTSVIQRTGTGATVQTAGQELDDILDESEGFADTFEPSFVGGREL
jgi:hypothetical protein